MKTRLAALPLLAKKLADAVEKSKNFPEQPERDVLVKERGRNGYFHYNGILAWGIDEDGVISHVYA